MKYKIYGILLLSFFEISCGRYWSNAPDVSVAGSKKTISTLAAGDHGGVLTVKMQMPESWAYWKAGNNEIVYQASEEFKKSNEWDLRISEGFPLFGTNGGSTAKSLGSNGLAAIALFELNGEAAARAPISKAETLGLSFVLDRFEALNAGGFTIPAMDQNPALNTIGPGVLAKYNANHTFEWSNHIFILRSADGNSYFWIQLLNYSMTDYTTEFIWGQL